MIILKNFFINFQKLLIHLPPSLGLEEGEFLVIWLKQQE